MKKNSAKELRQFALIMTIMILLLFAFFFPWLYELSFSYYPYFIAAIFLVVGLVSPKLLNPIHYLWIKLSSFLGFINSKLILFIIYYFMIVPMGLVAKLFGFDPMKKKCQTDTYYIQRKNTISNMENPF
jgi:hypothetical protein